MNRIGANNMQEAIQRIQQQLFRNNLNYVEMRDSYSTYMT